jgi:hypothetical protein
MTTTDKYVFFWGGPFSQWLMSAMKIDNCTYNCCEQYMMAQKALMFDDQSALRKIMASNRPVKQKEFGRMVKGFDRATWEKEARDIVYEANVAKFSQNLTIKSVLLGTDDKIIVEASPTDVIWGIGLGEDNPAIMDPKNWRGTNWLGEELMEVRKFLREEENKKAEKEKK